MAKKDIDWNNLGFGYVKTDKRYVSNFKDGAWDGAAGQMPQPPAEHLRAARRQLEA